MNVVMLRPITPFPGGVDYNFGAFCAVVSMRPTVFSFSRAHSCILPFVFHPSNQEKMERDCSVRGTTLIITLLFGSYISF